MALKEQNTHTLLFLGDSTSMTVGVERTMHPFQSADKNRWPENTRFVNCSLPGITSADAVTFYFRHKAALINDLRAVIIYLGNCDTAATEVPKGKVGKLKRMKFRLQEMTGKTPAKTSIKNRLLHFEWNNTYDPRIESPETGEDYEYNLSLIIKDCEANSLPVILVRPKANLFFPSGIGKGNFIFYRYFGIKDKIASSIVIPDSRFNEALAFHEAGDFSSAAAAYNNILLKPPASPMSLEYSLLVLNNYAVAKAEAGNYEEALYLLKLLLKERDVRKEIVLFNIAYIKKQMGLSDAFLETLHESYEADSSLFRVRSPYVEAVDRLAAAFPFVQTIDMHALIDDSLFLDHCHPLYEGQTILSDVICGMLAEKSISGSAQASIENILYNPELGSGNLSSFHDYFKTFAPFTESEIAAQVAQCKQLFAVNKAYDAATAAPLTREFRTALEYYLKHPCFTSVDDIMHLPPVYQSDIGRFPEYFLVRQLIPYLKMIGSDLQLVSLFANSPGLLRSADQLLSILPEKAKPLVAAAPVIDAAFEAQRVPAIVEKVKTLLAHHLAAGNQIFVRTKSTIFWYVRETLRFGSHARYSMRYDRMLMEFLAEGLAVAALLDQSLQLGKAAEIKQLVQLLHDTVAVHETHCRKFSLREPYGDLLVSYDQQLKNILVALTGKTSS